jgi:hypothetical protein
MILQVPCILHNVISSPENIRRIIQIQICFGTQTPSNPQAGQESRTPVVNILYAFLVSFNRATCPRTLIPLEVITIKLLLEEFKLWSSELRNFQISGVASCHIAKNILFSTLFSRSLITCTSLKEVGICKWMHGQIEAVKCKAWKVDVTLSIVMLGSGFC